MTDKSKRLGNGKVSRCATVRQRALRQRSINFRPRQCRSSMNLVSMEDILIDEVQQRPSIYDKTSSVYKNNRIREQAWKEVAKAVNMTGESVEPLNEMCM